MRDYSVMIHIINFGTEKSFRKIIQKNQLKIAI